LDNRHTVYRQLLESGFGHHATVVACAVKNQRNTSVGTAALRRLIRFPCCFSCGKTPEIQ